MKTENELKEMTKEELVNEAMSLQKQLESKRKEAEDWFKSYSETKRKFGAFREIVKGVVVLVD